MISKPADPETILRTTARDIFLTLFFFRSYKVALFGAFLGLPLVAKEQSEEELWDHVCRVTLDQTLHTAQAEREGGV